MGHLGPPTGNSSSLPGGGHGCSNGTNAEHCWSYDLGYFKNYTSTLHGLGLDVFAGINEIDYDYFPGAPNVTTEHVQSVAKHVPDPTNDDISPGSGSNLHANLHLHPMQVAAIAKAGGFDGAISDFEPAWVRTCNISDWQLPISCVLQQ
jgi:hypothetical protein